MDAYFDYDKSDIREDARGASDERRRCAKGHLRQLPGCSITIDGNCDERGSAEYNLALGDRRATAAKDFLVQLGVPADKLKTISYGKERPAVHRPRRRVLAKKPPRALLHRAVKSGKGRGIPGPSATGGTAIRPAHEEML